MTYADLAVADLLETAGMYTGPGMIEQFKTSYPTLYAVYSKTNADARVKSYKEKRGPKKYSDECWKAFEGAKAPFTCFALGGKPTWRWTPKTECTQCSTKCTGNERSLLVDSQ